MKKKVEILRNIRIYSEGDIAELDIDVAETLIKFGYAKECTSGESGQNIVDSAKSKDGKPAK